MQTLSPIEHLERSGVYLSVSGEKLLAGRPSGSLTKSDRQFIREHRKELFDSLTNQTKVANRISSILSGLYRQKSESEWEWLRINCPEWWAERIRLENELDGHFMNGEREAGQEIFYRLVYHLENAPIDKLSSRIARQLDGADPKQPEIPYKAWKPRKLPGHPEAWDGTRISGR